MNGAARCPMADKEKSTAINTIVPKNWTRELAAAIAAALREFHPQIGDTPIALFEVGCAPWHGFVELSILTAEEMNADSALKNPAEMAAWRFYNFATDLAAWGPAQILERQMSKAYYADSDGDHSAIADAFFRACAAAAATPEVVAAIGLLNRDARFRISVLHPDDKREFYPG